MKITTVTDAIERKHMLETLELVTDSPPGPVGIQGPVGIPGPVGIQGPIGYYAAEPVDNTTPSRRVPTEEEITAIAKLIDIGAGLNLPEDERAYVIKYNGVKICGYNGHTRFKTIGGAKISLMSSSALKKTFRTYLKALRGIPEDQPFAYSGCRGTGVVSNLVDELIKSGKITIELE